MNKKELKQMLKPLIKECIKEVIFEDGTLSSIVSEVAKGMGQQTIVETKQIFPTKQKPQYETDEQAKTRLDEKRNKMMDAVGAEAYNGINLFEGTTPAPAQTTDSGQGPLSDVDPKDAGVDISKVMGKSSAIWSKMVGK
jgi:hypothetical protein|tara:strand:- start:998 stop:1414 length:417 start_codon:yes stop_codon:yes gene_type:complete